MRIIWRIIKYFLLFILALIVLGLLWAGAAWVRGDDTLNPEIAAFYTVDKSQMLENNAAIAMMGLSAPADVSDSYGWTVQIIQKAQEERENYEAKYANKAGANFIDAATYGNVEVGFNVISLELDDLPNKTEYVGDNKTIGCWLDRSWFMNDRVTDDKNCDEQALRDLITKNQLLLSRYENSLHYTLYENHWSAAQGPIMINAQELYIANLVLLAQTNPELALQKWLVNMQLYKNALRGYNSLINVSILMVNHGLVQKALPSILGNNEELIAAHMNELLEALAPFSARDVNITSTMKAEHELIGPVIDRLGNYNRNKSFELHQEMIAAWNAPISEIDSKWERLNKKYKSNPSMLFLQWRDWHSPVLSITTNLILAGTLVGGDLAKAMHLSDARSRILNIYVQMKAQGIPAEKVPEFLAISSKVLYNPLTEKPFEYDASSKMIYFVSQPEYGYKQGLILSVD